MPKYLDETGTKTLWAKIKEKFQLKLVSGTNIKTVNGTSLLGSGNIVISGVSKLDVYPVGSIYMSVNSTSPASLFGGTWSKLENRFLLGQGSSYSAGSTGGASTVTLTESQIPSHQHNVNIGWSGGGSNTNTAFLDASGGRAIGGWWTTQANGSGQAHNNMPPYLVVYMWKRTA